MNLNKGKGRNKNTKIMVGITTLVREVMQIDIREGKRKVRRGIRKVRRGIRKGRHKSEEEGGIRLRKG